MMMWFLVVTGVVAGQIGPFTEEACRKAEAALAGQQPVAVCQPGLLGLCPVDGQPGAYKSCAVGTYIPTH
jgi:hypothetical protein